MALSPCTDCGHSVSLAAVTCPSCGRRAPAAEAQADRERWWGAVAVLALVVLVGAFLLEMLT